MQVRRHRGTTGIIVVLIVFAAIVSCVPSSGFDPDVDTEVLSLASVSDKELAARMEALGRKDAIAAYYIDPSYTAQVLDFFSTVTGSEDTAVAILDSAVDQRVAASLAFAVAYEESRFNPQAVSKNADSSDRGLFQLNSKSFPHLDEASIFDPETNANAGLGYLRNFLESAGNEVTALAMYNAGHGRVSKGGTPRATLDYISRVLKYEENITSLFTARVIARTSLLNRVRFGFLSGQVQETQGTALQGGKALEKGKAR
jgi:hypothetical protein